MKPYKTDILIFSGLLMLVFLISVLTAGQRTIDFQSHDTYYVIDKLSFTVWIIGPLTFLIFLVRGLRTKFKYWWTNTGLIVELVLVGLIAYQVFQH